MPIDYPYEVEQQIPPSPLSPRSPILVIVMVEPMADYNGRVSAEPLANSVSILSSSALP